MRGLRRFSLDGFFVSRFAEESELVSYMAAYILPKSRDGIYLYVNRRGITQLYAGHDTLTVVPPMFPGFLLLLRNPNSLITCNLSFELHP
ncbi:MAG: hypothetical protein RLZZ630_1722 [Bacteroidota bacterium]